MEAKIMKLAFWNTRAWTPFGEYEIVMFEDRWYEVYFGGTSVANKKGFRFFDSKEEAKHVAQADFEKRVLACFSKD